MLSPVRGTATFGFFVRTAPVGTWFMAAEGTLADPRPLECKDVLYEDFPLSAKVARYARFVVSTYYGLGGAIQYLEVLP